MFDEDRFIADLRSSGGKPSHGIRSALSSVRHDEIRKANWIYSQVAHRLGWQQRPTFEAEYLENILHFYLCAATATPSNSEFTPKKGDLLLSWHHPLWPSLISRVTGSDILVLLAQQAEWMTDFVSPENSLLFREEASLLRLLKAYRQGRPVACMMDFCYSGTSFVEGKLLGHHVQTPSGVLELAKRFNYQVVFLGVEDGEMSALDSIDASQHSIEYMADWYNSHLEAQITLDPATWLLWPSFDIRCMDMRWC